jgi:hypothetical protein
VITLQEAQQIIGWAVYDTAGYKIGSVCRVYLDDTTKRPEWVTVKTGLRGTRESFVPLATAHLRRAARALLIEVDKDTVIDAPNLDPDHELPPDAESSLYQYYGLQVSMITEPARHTRLRKHDVTQPAEQTAPVSREETPNQQHEPVIPRQPQSRDHRPPPPPPPPPPPRII